MSPTAQGSLPAAIGPYHVLAELGRGGMAFVYLAVARKHPSFTKLLVVKILRGELATEGDFVAMFMNEARVAAQLGHPNVVQTYEVGEHEGRPFIAMEYLEGQALSKVIFRAGHEGLPLGVHLRILTDMLDGLHYAHELVGLKGQPLGLVHRDVSPHNVLVTQGGLSKVLDFGIAKVIDTTLTREGVVKGKMGYMAPEQLSALPVDRRADIFAAGVMLWEALAGRKLVERDDVAAGVVHRRVTGTEPRLVEVRPDVPPQLVAVCEKAMAVRPEDRFATAAAMRDAIEAYSKAHAPADTRAVSDLVDQLFAEDRSNLRKLIEERLRADDAASASMEASAASLSLGHMTVASPSQSPPAASSATPPRSRRALAATAFAAGLLLIGIATFVYAMSVRDGRRTGAAVDGTSSPPPPVASLEPVRSSDPTPVVLSPVAAAAPADAAATASARAPSPAVPAVQELDPREQRKRRVIYTEDPYK